MTLPHYSSRFSFFHLAQQSPPPTHPTLQWARASSFTRFLDHTQRHITFGSTPLYEWPARRRDLYLTTHNTHNRHTSMPPVGFEPTNSAGEQPQSYVLDRADTGIGNAAASLQNLPTEPLCLMCRGVRFIEVFIGKFCTASFCFLTV